MTVCCANKELPRHGSRSEPVTLWRGGPILKEEFKTCPAKLGSCRTATRTTEGSATHSCVAKKKRGALTMVEDAPEVSRF